MSKGFDCDKCQHKRCDDSNPASFIMWEIQGVIASKTCLLPMVTHASNTYIKLYRHYKNGILIYEGGLLNQPNPFIEAMGIIDERLESDGRNRNES